jgi:16S rRNA (guanine527-N7)-methyltransferase
MADERKARGEQGSGIDDRAWASFERWCRDLDIVLGSDCRAQLDAYKELLLDWNARVNLTAIRAPREILIKHFLDSLTVLKHVRPAGGLLDIGTGGGFPGLVLKIARPTLPVTLVEARGRKVAFLEEVRRRLGLEGCTILHRHLGPGDPTLSRQFSAVVSRAFRDPRKFLQLSQGFLSPGGCAIAMLGTGGVPSGGAAVLAAKAGGSLRAFEQLSLPEGSGARQILVVAWPAA